MAQETQIDLHEIDKLLDDDDFVDDFDFVEASADQFADSEDSEDSEDSVKMDDDELDELLADVDLEPEPQPGDAKPVQEEPAVQLETDLNLDLDFETFDFGSSRRSSWGRVLKVVVSLVVLLWLVQLCGVIYLLRRPVIIRDKNQSIAVETVVAPGSEAETEAEPEVAAIPEMVVPESPDKPDMFIFTPCIQLYSLDGLKVFSVEVEIVQYQKNGRLTDAAKIRLKEGIRHALAISVAGYLREEIVDIKARLLAIIVPYINKFFSERGVDIEKIRIRVRNPVLQ